MDIAHLFKIKLAFVGFVFFFFKQTSSLEIVLLKQQNRFRTELLSRFWTDAQANLSLLSSLVSLSLSTCPHSTPHHQLPVSTCASRCDYNDEYVAAVCLRV